MEKRLILDEQRMKITIDRLCHQILEKHQDFKESVLIGMQPKGVFLANRIKKSLEKIIQKEIALGELDVTFYRDDFRRRDYILKPNATKIEFVIENKTVFLIDDVLYTGRSSRAALDALLAFGRPKQVELLVMIDRLHSRDVPIEPNYIGKAVNSIHSQRVEFEWKEQGFAQDSIWLYEKILEKS